MAKNEDRRDDPYARESFTFRRMTRTQLWAITVVAIVVVLAALAYVAG